MTVDDIIREHNVSPETIRVLAAEGVPVGVLKLIGYAGDRGVSSYLALPIATAIYEGQQEERR